MQKLAFLLGSWSGRLTVNLTYALGFETNGTLVGSWDMNGHFLKLRGTTRFEGGKSVDVEVRLAYDTGGKTYRGFFFTDGLATAWYAKGNFKGKDLVMRCKAVDAQMGEMTATVRPKAGAIVEIELTYPKMHKRDKMLLTMRRVE